MKERKVRIGVIADDFTGAADAASFLQQAGGRVILCTEIPEQIDAVCDCIVIACKIRSVDAAIATAVALRALAFLKMWGAQQIYYKFCSTFDSTPKGNIGPVMDALMEACQEPYALLCPALPINQRTVKAGVLYVAGVPLAQSPLKDHPLNPMWDSRITELMRPQSKYPCVVLRREQFDLAVVREIEKRFAGQPFYLVPDFENEEDGRRIAQLFTEKRFSGGGSGLLAHIRFECSKKSREESAEVKQAVILCGSCSRMTRRQIDYYIQAGYPALGLDGKAVAEGIVRVEDALRFIHRHPGEAPLIYSDAAGKELSREMDEKQLHSISACMEQFFAKLGVFLKAERFDRIVVAGGETSGALTQRLGERCFLIGRQIAPGVPLLYPCGDTAYTLVLKSGNFGDEDFFVKAVR